MIHVQELTKYYGPVKAIDRVSFKVEEGEILGFLGPNGAGKTTTMRILTCFMPATSGSASVAGYDVFKDSLQVRRSIGYLPENVPIYPEMTVYGYLNFVAELKGLRWRERRVGVEQVIERCGLEDVVWRLTRNISKGYRQRVGLAQALLGNPPVLILDEPTVGLDPRQIIDIRNLIKSLAESATIILCTHILPEVSMTCNKVAIINKGRIVSFGHTDQLMASHDDEGMDISVVAEGPEEELMASLTGLPGIEQVTRTQLSQGARHFLTVTARPGEDPRRAIAELIAAKKWGLLELHARDVTLEEIFVRTVSADILDEDEELAATSGNAEA
jgi:ABC-2 type transport system ATP-binding protein